MISASKCLARSIAIVVFPEAVGPATIITVFEDGLKGLMDFRLNKKKLIVES
jgi:hypothetical protein